jgi:hypothetical protein
MYCALKRIKALGSRNKDTEIAQKRAIIGAFDPLRKQRAQGLTRLSDSQHTEVILKATGTLGINFT